MKLLVLYHPDSEHESEIMVFIKDCEKQFQKAPDLISLDTVEGSRIAELYDITSYPAMIAVREDGELSQLWQGLPLPLIREVGYYA